MIHDLALFEDASDECTVTEKSISTALFGRNSVRPCFLAEVDGQVAAMAL
jgi:hypothetical protein